MDKIEGEAAGKQTPGLDRAAGMERVANRTDPEEVQHWQAADGEEVERVTCLGRPGELSYLTEDLDLALEEPPLQNVSASTVESLPEDRCRNQTGNVLPLLLLQQYRWNLPMDCTTKGEH